MAETAHYSPVNTEPQNLEDEFEAEANAMVDSLVGLDDDDDDNEDFLRPGPMTPPSRTSTSPFNSGIHAGEDRLDVRGHTPSGHMAPVSPGHKPSLLNGLSHEYPRTMQSPSLAQLPSHSPRAHPGYLGWGTTQHAQQAYHNNSRPTTASQLTPLVPPGLGRHSRINSAEAIPWTQDNGLASPWIPDNTWSTFAPTDGNSSTRSNRQSLLDRNLGNGTFGEIPILPHRESQMGRSGSFRGSPLVASGEGWGTPERADFGRTASPFYERQMSFSGMPTTPIANPVASIGSGRPKPIK